MTPPPAPHDPMIFWGIYSIALLAIGMLAHISFESWWLRWSAGRKRQMQKNSPNVMRQRYQDAERLNQLLMDERDKFRDQVERNLTEIQQLKIELRRVNGRNRHMANELRCDESAETINLGALAPFYRPSRRN